MAMMAFQIAGLPNGVSFTSLGGWEGRSESSRASPPLASARRGHAGVLFMASDLTADHSGKVLAISGQEIAEFKMLMTEGFRPKGIYTAQDVAAQAASVFFPADLERVVPKT
ncbi:hypothetical protein [Bradyrhizobium icense]|uniref:Uncharacterized protein n=1 Tax=Bradyrhizobium icense TaxID=1274631 RepID=A0A1B1UJR9_9BRAD|nr:hypothetical protein [Bradyrhizobium icense]ANW03006.1 hypothetical protein LMTR13_25480 [Bradyrhizobium icense]